ncbi:equilibrative nucleoside transporter-like protein [Dermatophagoides farinae]|uniref:Equilibrative nucleoside transporter-like protein n=1 Tax=Dermatophagoides farinae TaxID=6954 RepID=A0A9D4P6T0_DERFA|nr:equilibrative nucleoside transporter 3-like [Dermatophagoides farinae]KAH7645168.1 equilibrative nucleoside transporter-like protein [Dermatophagoides farinae]
MNANNNRHYYPLDKWHLIKIVFILHGISALLPWNMLINADSYFVDYKLVRPNQTTTAPFSLDNVDAGLNITEIIHSDLLENYRQNFLPYLSTASKVPNIIFQLVNLLFSSSPRSYRIRMNVSFLVQIALFIIMIGLAFIDTSEWPVVFFWITMIIAVLFNTVNGIFQSCIYGFVAKFPMKYINFVTFGFSFSGTIASIFLIVSLMLSPHPRTVALYYFSFATAFMILCYVNEIFLTKNRFFRYYFYGHANQKLAAHDNPLQVQAKNGDLQMDNVNNIIQHENEKNEKMTIKTFKLVWNKCWIQLMNSVLIYFSTFVIFPAIQAAIKPLDSIVEQKFFAPVFCFLFFNTFASIGNYVAERIRRPEPAGLIYLVAIRFLFIPFFLFCNYIPDRRTWPVLIQSDYVYILGSASLAFSNGYASSLAMMYAPKCVPQQYAPISGMMASAAVIIGIIIGVQCSMLFQALIT